MTTAIDNNPELFHGLTIYGEYGGAQVRETARVTGWEDGLPVIDGSEHSLVLAFKPDAPRSSENGDPFILAADEARALRDLLNVATARGAL